MNFTPLSLERYDTVLVVDVDGVGDNILKLPISARLVGLQYFLLYMSFFM